MSGHTFKKSTSFSRVKPLKPSPAIEVHFYIISVRGVAFGTNLVDYHEMLGNM